MSTTTIAIATRTKKSAISGTSVETVYEMDKPNRFLIVTTMKGSRGVHTSFQSVKSKDINSGGFSFVMFMDFNKVVRYPTVTRATEKALNECHSMSLHKIEDTLKEANEFYLSKEGEELEDLAEAVAL